jgi:hypothetical protein
MRARAIEGPDVCGPFRLAATECNIGLALSSNHVKAEPLHDYRQFSCVLVRDTQRISFELFHEQLPLPVPCYDLLPVTELAVTPPK